MCASLRHKQSWGCLWAVWLVFTKSLHSGRSPSYCQALREQGEFRVGERQRAIPASQKQNCFPSFSRHFHFPRLMRSHTSAHETAVGLRWVSTGSSIMSAVWHFRSDPQRLWTSARLVPFFICLSSLFFTVISIRLWCYQHVANPLILFPSHFTLQHNLLFFFTVISPPSVPSFLACPFSLLIAPLSFLFTHYFCLPSFSPFLSFSLSFSFHSLCFLAHSCIHFLLYPAISLSCSPHPSLFSVVCGLGDFSFDYSVSC